MLTLPVPCILENCIEIKINLNFHFHTSLCASKTIMKAFKVGLSPFKKDRVFASLKALQKW